MNKEERRNHFAAIALAQLLIPENFAGVLKGATAKKMDLNKAMALTCVDLADALITELDRTATVKDSVTLQPDADGWIPHKPGDPMPCSEDALVVALYRGGWQSHRAVPAIKLPWGGPHNHGGDLIAWKPAE